MSSYLLPVFYAILQLIILIAVGFIARRVGQWSDAFFAALSAFVIRVALPLYFVSRVGRTDISDVGQILVMPIAAACLIAAGLIVSHALFAALPFTGSSRRAGIALAAFGNAGYIPLTLAEIVPISVPVVASRYSTELVPIQIAAFLFVFSPLLWSLGSLIITTPDGGRNRFQWTKLVSPPLIGILIGIGISLSGIGTHAVDPRLPFHHILEAIDRLSAITLPLALVCLGALIGGLKVPRGAFGHYVGMALSVCTVRFLLFPALFFALYTAGLLRFLGPPVLFAIFLEMHTPPATNFSLMVGKAGVNTEHTAVTLLVSYAVYLVAMPIYLLLLLAIG